MRSFRPPTQELALPNICEKIGVQTELGLPLKTCGFLNFILMYRFDFYLYNLIAIGHLIVLIQVSKTILFAFALI
jgi:hypothetical protein